MRNRLGPLLLALTLHAQPTEPWNGSNAPIRLRTSAERHYKTRLTEAARLPPNFAGHYHFAQWGCGSDCVTGAIIDLHTGLVYPPPAHGKLAPLQISGGLVEGDYTEFNKFSRLLLVRHPIPTDPTKQEHIQYIWENNRFRVHSGQIVPKRNP